MKKKECLRNKQNKLAMENSVREEDYIFYDIKYPLVINEDSKISLIEKLKGEEEDGATYRIIFTERVNNKEAYQEEKYFMDVKVYDHSINEIEKYLLSCECEQDIELIEDMLDELI